MAPRDVVDEWDTVLDPLHRLRDVLAEHDVDPSTYDGGAPPADLDPAARREIEAAARAAGSSQAVTAMGALEQQALDVCGTPLSR